jgi:hypothetical protein
MPNVPIDGRPQFTTIGLALSSVTGGPGLDDVTQIMPGVDRYVVTNAWPRPKPSAGGFSGAIAASAAATERKPMSPAQRIWPNLPSAGG